MPDSKTDIMIDYIEISGYKSIKHAKVVLRPVNILIGANGAGKSNLISFFEFLNQLYQKKLQDYVALKGGVNKMLHKGSKNTERITARIAFKNGESGYEFEIRPGDGHFVFLKEYLIYENNKGKNISSRGPETFLKNTNSDRAEPIKEHLTSFKKYHFQDTGSTSAFNDDSHITNDGYFLYDNGKNLSAFLYKINQERPIIYNRIVKIIQSIAPYFSDFYFHPNESGYIRLQWQDRYSSFIYGANDLSDGTIRFVALTTLLMQPNLPATVIIDEPELGLHPFAVRKLAGMIQSAASKHCQIIIATQSTDLMGQFAPEDIITVDLDDGESRFNRLDSESLKLWLEDYTLDDLWKRSIIQGGQPK